MSRGSSRRRSPDAPAGAAAGSTAVAGNQPAAFTGAAPAEVRRTLEIEVAWGDIASGGGTCAVGHYIGVLPQRAELVIDWAVSGTRDERRLLLTDLTKRGALRGELGEVAFFPMTGGSLAAVAGMGRPGTFNAPRLKTLTRALVGCVGLLPEHDTLSTVLIGSGEGNSLKVRDCVENMLKAAVEMLADDPRLRLSRLRIVELHQDRALEVLRHVKRVVDRNWRDRGAGDLEVTVEARLQPLKGGRIDTQFGCSMVLGALAEAAGSGDASLTPLLERVLSALPDDDVKDRVRTALVEARKASTETEVVERLRSLAMAFRIERDGEASWKETLSRLSFWVDQDDIRATAITDTVTVTEREFRKRFRLVQSALQRLQDPEPKHQPKYSADLYRSLVHPDLRELIHGRTEALVVEVDPKLASVQWEMLPGFDGNPLGVARPVARQLRTQYSPRPSEIGTRDKLRVLVIGDPGDPARGESLPDTHGEAQVVWDILAGSDRIDKENSLRLVGAPADGTLAGPLFDQGIPPADYFEVVQRLLSGDFDIVHYCGHAQFDPENPSEAGWVFKADVLTAADLDGMVRAPILVVANACLSARSGQAPNDKGVSRKGDPKLVAALADEFFRCGVADYVGTAWEVSSNPATLFAEKFYRELLGGESIGESVRRAREALYRRKENSCTWGAYQHYGDPTRSLFKRTG